MGVLERLKSTKSHKRKSRLDGGKEEVKRRKDELLSHLESIQLLCVGGLLPLQTVRQLRADLSRRVKKKQKTKKTRQHHPHAPRRTWHLLTHCWYLFVVCDDARRPTDLLLRLLQLPSKHFLQLPGEREACQSRKPGGWGGGDNDEEEVLLRYKTCWKGTMAAPSSFPLCSSSVACSRCLTRMSSLESSSTRSSA